MQRYSIDRFEVLDPEKAVSREGSKRNLNSTIGQITGLKYNPFKCPSNLEEARIHRVL